MSYRTSPSGNTDRERQNLQRSSAGSETYTRAADYSNQFAGSSFRIRPGGEIGRHKGLKILGSNAVPVRVGSGTKVVAVNQK